MKPIAFGLLVCVWLPGFVRAGEQELVRVGDGGRGFEMSESKQAFVPWGFNYDHDEQGRLIEDYWEAEWAKVEQDFHEMRELGANVVRIHLQVGKFMDDTRTPNKESLEQLGRLVALAENEGLYLDVTGLGCYHKKDVPAWYDQLAEQERWDAQARFWEAIAERCAKSDAVFCYDLMNEPVAPGGDKAQVDWLGPAFAGKHFVQRIALDRKERERHEIAQEWIGKLTSAIRKHDRRHMITVGLVDWSLDRPGLSSGFIPEKVAGDLDFIAVHLYPKAGKLDEAIETLKGFSVGKPVVIEETFPLACSADELGEFIDRSNPHAAGWIGFYWGKTPAEYRNSNTIQDALVLSWLALFERKRPGVKLSP
jgi:Cellulase (glycosyl hydrolase family 5)